MSAVRAASLGVLFLLAISTGEGKELFVYWEVFSLASIPVEFVLLLDKIRILFTFTVILISWRVWEFSQFYIIGETYYWRFHIIFILFVIRINCLILSPNILRIFLGWDGLGVTSYLLVTYYQNYKRRNAGFITMFTNRVGDVLILLRIALTLPQGSFNARWVPEFTRTFDPLCLLICLAAATKRAQIPFSSWLPAAIAAPTPVSSLVHSSTLVTAGVYLLVRFQPLIEPSYTLRVVLYLGATTTFLSGIRAVYERDIKKVVALSTLRQLGLMFIALGINMPEFCFFHLISHAYTKAFLFIVVGFYIHLSRDYQDVRILSSNKTPPVLSFFFSISLISLTGLPFTFIFFTKEAVIIHALTNNRPLLIWPLVFFMSILLTVTYRLVVLKKMYLSDNRTPCYPKANTLKGPWVKQLIRSCLSFYGVILFLSPISWDINNGFYATQLLPSEISLTIYLILISSGVLGLSLNTTEVFLQKRGWSLGRMFALIWVSPNIRQTTGEKLALAYKTKLEGILFQGHSSIFAYSNKGLNRVLKNSIKMSYIQFITAGLLCTLVFRSF